MIVRCEVGGKSPSVFNNNFMQMSNEKPRGEPRRYGNDGNERGKRLGGAFQDASLFQDAYGTAGEAAPDGHFVPMVEVAA